MKRALTALEELLARAHGLAIAAVTVTGHVEARVVQAVVREELGQLREDARRTRAWCLDVEASLGDEELAQELLAHANTVEEKSADLVGNWFKAGTGPLEAVTFLAMAEAAEVATWRALAELAVGGGDASLVELVEWALPVQQRHLEIALDTAALLGRAADPAAPRWG